VTGPAWVPGQNAGVTTGTTPSAAAERLRLRYPRSRLPRPVLVGGVAVLAAVFLAWLVWTALIGSNPAVTGQVSAYRVVSDQEVTFTLTVDRPDPSRAAVCRVVAQSADYQAVGALDVEVPPRPERVVDVTGSLKTLRRATNASFKSCSLR
jgi:hypothetical protein